MHTTLMRKWKIWLHRRRRRKAIVELQKRKAILQKGMQLYVQVLDVRPTRIRVDQMQLVRLQLRIRLLNDSYLSTVSATFIQGNCAQLKGQYLRVRFLPSDLSHVVLLV